MSARIQPDLPPPGNVPRDLVIEPRDFNFAVQKLRAYFEGMGFIEVHTQSRLSILAACEDPSTVATYEYLGQRWPLPQTGQMWLEYEFARDPTAPGYFCVTTSYREEPQPVAGRHLCIFPLFEFETAGGMDRLREIEQGLVRALGFDAARFASGTYADVCARFGVEEVDHAEEDALYTKEKCPAYWLESFPESTSPFWNMKRNDDGKTAAKIDVILCGQETIGSAERATDVAEMRRRFYTIEGGAYSKMLFDLFGKERVEAELEGYLALPFYPRCGGGIGMTRLIRAMKLEGLM